MSRFHSLLALAAVALAIAPAAASAHPGQRGFSRTFPHASRLCARTVAGREGKTLAASADKVVAACTTLRTSFTNALNAYLTTTAPLHHQAVLDVRAMRATCRQAHASGNTAACQAARSSTRAALKNLRAQVRTAAQTYHTSVQAARQAFWATIHALRGGSAITPDTTTPPAPSVSIPSS